MIDRYPIYVYVYPSKCIISKIHTKRLAIKKFDCCNSFYDNENDSEFDDDDDDAEEEEEECALVVFSGRFPQLPLTEQNISPANDDDDDDDGLPAHSHHDKIPPWWEYVSNDMVAYSHH